MKVISITNRSLCKLDFLSHIRNISNTGLLQSIYLREKDLSEQEYGSLLEKVLEICNGNVELFGVKYINITQSLEVHNIHLSYEEFLKNYTNLGYFQNISVSVHSLNEAVQCETLGATRLVTGHIFNTDCKKNLLPRGLEYLKNVCNVVKIPVYAIGGISYNNVKSVIDNGAMGVCIMSTLMQCENPKILLQNLYYAQKGKFYEL